MLCLLGIGGLSSSGRCFACGQPSPYAPNATLSSSPPHHPSSGTPGNQLNVSFILLQLVSNKKVSNLVIDAFFKIINVLMSVSNSAATCSEGKVCEASCASSKPWVCSSDSVGHVPALTHGHLKELNSRPSMLPLLGLASLIVSRMKEMT